MKKSQTTLVCYLIISGVLFSNNAGGSFFNQKALIEDEKNTISIFNKNIYSVVNITSIKLARLWP
ncbi:MAG: hypothetical protein OXB84_00745, partial [Halobacteriovoraceae bacterium]|nr:hypothetical protein [Halobacteriovoraceae bacterium]